MVKNTETKIRKLNKCITKSNSCMINKRERERERERERAHRILSSPPIIYRTLIHVQM